MAESLTIIASLWTIWAQSSILAENGEFERFKDKESPPVEHRFKYQQRRLDIVEASIKRRNEILANNEIVISQTRLGN